MKKILVCVLSIALALGMMPVAIGAANPGVVAEVKKSGNTVTVTVKLPAVTKLTACVVSVEFDPDIVSIPDNTSGYAATRDVEGETIPYFIGEHTGGLPDGMDDDPVPKFRFEPGLFRRHDVPRIRYPHQFRHRSGEQGKRHHCLP